MKVKILKDYAAGKVGDIVDVSFPGGDEQEYIDNGFIEIIEEEPIKANTSNSQIIDYTKYNKLLDPNRETDKIKVKFLRDYGEYKKDEETFISSKNFFLFSERGYCESIKSTEPTIKAFEDFERINNLETINQKHREWLKDYVELRYSIATNSVHKMKWEKEPVYYDNSLYSQEINCIGRKPNRLIIEFDAVENKPDNPKNSLAYCKKIFNHYKIGYIQSTHNSKNSDYLWVEFNRELTTEEAEQFLAWVCPNGARIDLNFSSDNKVFPVLFAKHWKYSDVREFPINFFKGNKINFDILKLPKQKIKGNIVEGVNGFKYKTFKGDEDIGVNQDFLIFNKNGKVESIHLDNISNYLIEKHCFKTWFGVKSDYSFNWNGKTFDRDTRGIIKVECENLLKFYCKRNIVDEILEKVKRKTKVDREEFEKDDTNFINLDNGVWDIQQKKLSPHNPKYNFQYIIEIKKDNNPLNVHNCPNWLRFIDETLYPEDVAVMQEWFGFLLFREYFIKKAMIGVGEQDTGKSVLMDTAIKFVGEKNKTGLSLQKISGGSDFTKLSLKGKMLNAYDDLSSRDINDGGAFKVATGGGYISGEEKFGEFQQFRSFAKIMLMGNKIPPVKDNDDLAYFGRFIPIKFDNVPEKINPFLRKKLWTDEEMSGILNWALEGLYRLLKNGKFSYNKTNQETKDIMEISGCPLIAFSSEVLEKDDNNVITKDDMFIAYSIWCDKTKRPRLTKEMLGRRLAKYCPYIFAVGGNERIWRNAKIKDDFGFKNNLNVKPYTNDTLKKPMSTIQKTDILHNNSEYRMGDIIKNKVSETSLKKLCKFCNSPTKITETDLSKHNNEKLNRCTNKDCLAIMNHIPNNSEATK